MRSVSSVLRGIRRAWADAPVVVKGLRVVALPVLALVLTSSLVLVADRQREHAHDQREAAEAIDTAAGEVRAISAKAAAVATESGKADPATLAAIMRYRGAWDVALRNVESAALAEPDDQMQADVHELRAATENLIATTVEGFQPTTDRAALVAMGARVAAANDRFVSAIDAISVRARNRAMAYADQYDSDSRTMSRLIAVGALVGAAGAILAMVAFALSIRRRVRVLQANSEAIGTGSALRPFGTARDELGRLGRGLDDAAALLRDREQALHDVAETLRQKERTLALAVDAGRMGTWDVDLLTGAGVWDARNEEQHGVAPGEFGGTFDAWLDRVHPDDRSDVMAAGGGALAAGGRWEAEYRVNLTDGTVRWIGIAGQVGLGDDGKPARLVGVGTDITDRKVGEQRLRQAMAEAEQANHAKNDFLSRVSHELRTPLNAILGFSQLLELDELTESQRESLSQVLSGGRHLLGLIDDVLDISRIESGNLAVSLEPTSVREALAETVALVSSTAAGYGVTVEVPETAWSDAHVRADRRRLKQILVNLATNAVKYNHRGGRVTFLLTSPVPGVLRIGVRDTGQGIPAEQLDRLFTPFDRLGAEQTNVEGAGIGLALSQRLAEMMDATVSVTSEVGTGSTFSLDVDLVDDAVMAAGAGAQVPEQDAGERSAGTVLYVEDNPSNLRLVQRILERREGIRLLTAGTGGMALSMAGRIPVDVILLDLHLPDMNGAEVLRQLRQRPETARTPVVVVSADASPGQLGRLRAAGADAFLSKPFDIGEFLVTVDGFLAGVHA
jgi:signal transduction histidine kinase/CheY-like chemotaxis protein